MSLKEYVANQDKAVSKQMADVESYLAITDTKLTAQQLRYIRDCMICCHAAGYGDASEAIAQAQSGAYAQTSEAARNG